MPEEYEMVPVEQMEPRPIVAVPEEKKDELAELSETPEATDNDMVVAHLFNIDEEEDLSDLVDVGNITGMDDEDDEDNIVDEGTPGMPPTMSRTTPRYRIAKRGSNAIYRPQPPTSIQGMQ